MPAVAHEFIFLFSPTSLTLRQRSTTSILRPIRFRRHPLPVRSHFTRGVPSGQPENQIIPQRKRSTLAFRVGLDRRLERPKPLAPHHRAVIARHRHPLNAQSTNPGAHSGVIPNFANLDFFATGEHIFERNRLESGLPRVARGLEIARPIAICEGLGPRPQTDLRLRNSILLEERKAMAGAFRSGQANALRIKARFLRQVSHH